MFEEANRAQIFPINMPLQRSHTPCGLVCALSGNRTQVCEQHRFANRLLKQSYAGGRGQQIKRA